MIVEINEFSVFDEMLGVLTWRRVVKTDVGLYNAKFTENTVCFLQNTPL